MTSIFDQRVKSCTIHPPDGADQPSFDAFCIRIPDTRLFVVFYQIQETKRIGSGWVAATVDSDFVEVHDS